MIDTKKSVEHVTEAGIIIYAPEPKPEPKGE